MSNRNGIAELFKRYRELNKEIRDLEKERDHLLETLKSKVPKNERKAGVHHQVSTGKSVSYAKALPSIKELVPKTKKEEVEKILEENTTYYERHKIKEDI